MSRATLAWRVYAVIAAALALLGLGHWFWSITLRGPVLYGEGAVAHASLLARQRLEYADSGPSIFTAANYPPLFFHLAGIGDPFVTGRIVSIASVLFVAGAIAWRARPAGRLVAASIALAWLGSVPVLQWGSALKPDLLAIGLTVGAVVLLDRERPRHLPAGVLLGLAAVAKPTALLPAAALFVFIARTEPRGALRLVGGAAAAAVIALLVTYWPDAAMWRHVVVFNQLPWRFDLAASLWLVAVLVLVVPIVAIALTRPSRTIVTAYAIGAIGVLALGGREGATINYFLDLSAAIALALAGRAPIIAAGSAYPIAAIVQAGVALLLLNPFGVIPGRPVATGAWGEPSRASYPAHHSETVFFAEDSGLLVANDREPFVDDLFLWSRLRERESRDGLSFPEGDRFVRAVRDGRFRAVLSEVDLEHDISGFEAQRWSRDLVAAVRERIEMRDLVLVGWPWERERTALYVYYLRR